MSRDWLAVLSPENFERTREAGFTVQGFKSRHRRRVESMSPGDRLAYYLIREGRFAAVALVASGCFEERTRIWRAPGRPLEVYPWRVQIAALLVPAVPERPRAADLVSRLEFVKRWPAAHWRLAFQGMLREIPVTDGARIRAALAQGLQGMGQEGHPG